MFHTAESIDSAEHSAMTPAAMKYGIRLRQRLGLPEQVAHCQPHPAERIATCGLLTLCGESGQLGVLPPVPLATCADEAIEAFRDVCGVAVLKSLSGADLLTERAHASSLHQNGSRSTNGQCRLLRSADGMIGLNMARESDWDLMPAWLEETGAMDWPALTSAIGKRPTITLIERGQLLGLAIADATGIPTTCGDWLHCQQIAAPYISGKSRPRVIDLSSLWAGPLASRLWLAAGAEVIKVESRLRPDGGRLGSPEFFKLLNQGKTNITLDLHTPEGQIQLRQLILSADIVLEASRPRALRQLGIDAEALIAAKPGLTWVSITGHGRQAPEENWIGYGDDAGIAAGLSAALHQATGQWLVCGDAIADPMTGIHAALAGWATWLSGGGCLLDLSLSGTVRHCLTATAPKNNDYKMRYQRWQRHLTTLQSDNPSKRLFESAASLY